MALSLTEEDIVYIRSHLHEWLQENPWTAAVNSPELLERMTRFEQELIHQRDLLTRMFDQVDKRFEQVDKRFEQVDKRFEQVDKRFDEMLRRHDRQFMWLIGFIATVGALIVAAGELL